MPTYSVSLVRRIQQAAGVPTFTELGPIKWTGLTVTEECGAPGSIEVTTTVDALHANLKTALLDLAATPCELWCYRTDDIGTQVIHAGHLSGYSISERQITFAGVGLLAYLQVMIRTTTYTATADDQATIVAGLIDGYQSQTYGNYGLDTSTLTSTGIARDLTLNGSELNPLDRVIGEMGARENGFDLTVDPETRAITIDSPRKGSDLSASLVIDHRSIGDPQYAQFVPLGQIASDVAVIGSSVEGITLTASDSDTAVRAAFGRAMMSATFSDVTEQTTLDDHAGRLLGDNSDAFQQITPGLKTVPGFTWRDFASGDVVTYEYDAGLGVQTSTPRVKTKAVSVNEGIERLSVGFF